MDGRADPLERRPPRAARPAPAAGPDRLRHLPHRGRGGAGDPRHGGARRAGDRLRGGFRGCAFAKARRKLRDPGEEPADGGQPVLGARADDARRRTSKAEAKAIFAEDLAANRAMGKLGAALIPQGARVMTHCNTGALATAGLRHRAGSHSVFEEQEHLGDRVRDAALPAGRAPHRLRAACRKASPARSITDNMAGHLMSRGEVDVVVVGADRIAANGDVANKIGTYTLAVLAKRHGIPFYVAAPLSTFDPKIPDGSHIPIEERPAGRGHRLPRRALGARGRHGAQPGVRRHPGRAHHRDHLREGRGARAEPRETSGFDFDRSVGRDEIEELGHVAVAHAHAADRAGLSQLGAVGRAVDVDVAPHGVDVAEAVAAAARSPTATGCASGSSRGPGSARAAPASTPRRSGAGARIPRRAAARRRSWRARCGGRAACRSCRSSRPGRSSRWRPDRSCRRSVSCCFAMSISMFIAWRRRSCGATRRIRAASTPPCSVDRGSSAPASSGPSRRRPRARCARGTWRRRTCRRARGSRTAWRRSGGSSCSVAAAARSAWISACAVGSAAAIGRFQPSPTIWPSSTTTAPIGTSPSVCARRASSSARRIYSSSLITRRFSQMASPFAVRSFRFQWPADLATSWAFEMEALILGWYILSTTGSVQQLVIVAALVWLGSLFSPFFGLAGDRIGHRTLLCLTRGVYARARRGAGGAHVERSAAALARVRDRGARRPAAALRHGDAACAGRPDHAARTCCSARSASRAPPPTPRAWRARSPARPAWRSIGMGPAYVVVTAMYVAAFLLSLGVAGAPPRAQRCPGASARRPAGRLQLRLAQARPARRVRHGFPRQPARLPVRPRPAALRCEGGLRDRPVRPRLPRRRVLDGRAGGLAARGRPAASRCARRAPCSGAARCGSPPSSLFGQTTTLARRRAPCSSSPDSCRASALRRSPRSCCAPRTTRCAAA